MTLKEISLLGLFTALTIAIYFVLSPIYLVAFVLTVLSLKPRQAYIFAFVTGVLTWVISSRIEVIVNMLWLPLIVLLLKSLELYIYDGKLSDGCLSNPSRHHHLRLALVSFVGILLANLGSEMIAMWVQDLGFEYIIISSPIWVGGAILNAILIGFTGIQSQRRISKILKKLSF